MAPTYPPQAMYGHIQTVKYNGQPMPMPKVSYSGTAQYDSTGRALVGWNLTFNVECVFIGSSAGGDSHETSFVNQLQTFLTAISVPRETFEWTTDESIVWHIVAGENAPDPDGGTDVTHIDKNFGPKPKVVNVSTITAMKSARVTWSMDTFVTVCDDTFEYNLTNDCVEFAWTWDYAFDRNFRCTRMVNGRYKFRSGIKNADGTLVSAADLVLNNLAYFPALSKYFYRESMHHSLSPDGTELTFTVVDKQVWRTLPKPLTSGFATFRMEHQATVGLVFKTLQCSFEAPTNVDKACIVEFIHALMKYRFPNAKLIGDLSTPGSSAETEWITQLSVTNYEFENRVDCTVVSQGPVTNLLDAEGNPRLPAELSNDVGKLKPATNAKWSQVNGVSVILDMTGTAGEVPPITPELEVCYPPQVPYPDGPNVDMSEVIGEPTRLALSPGEYTAPAADAPSTSAATRSYLYTKYIETWHYFVDHHCVQLKASAPSGVDFVQQTMQPTFRLIQVGCAERIGMPPKVPEPALVDTQELGYYVNLQDVRVDNPGFCADGVTPIHKLHWSYEIMVPSVHALVNTKTAGAARVMLPDDPRWDRATGAGSGSQLDKVLIEFPQQVAADGTASHTRAIP